MARHSHEVVNHASLDAVGSNLRLVGDLGVIFVEVLWELHYRFLDELQVASSAYDDTERYGVVCLHLSFVYLSRDAEPPHSTREIGWSCGQRVNLKGESRSNNFLLHLYIA